MPKRKMAVKLRLFQTVNREIRQRTVHRLNSPVKKCLQALSIKLSCIVNKNYHQTELIHKHMQFTAVTHEAQNNKPCVKKHQLLIKLITTLKAATQVNAI